MERRENKRVDAELRKLEQKVLSELGEPKFNFSFVAPVEAGYIKYTDLLNGGLTLFDIEIMNEAIDYNAKIKRVANGS
jgi:hypothetical protein